MFYTFRILLAYLVVSSIFFSSFLNCRRLISISPCESSKYPFDTSIIQSYNLTINPLKFCLTPILTNCKTGYHLIPSNKTQERQWLIDLYNSTNGNDWIKNQNWLSNDDYCHWHNIRCCNHYLTYNKSNRKPQIVYFDESYINSICLTYNNLTGTLPNW